MVAWAREVIVPPEHAPHGEQARTALRARRHLWHFGPGPGNAHSRRVVSIDMIRASRAGKNTVFGCVSGTSRSTEPLAAGRVSRASAAHSLARPSPIEKHDLSPACLRADPTM